MKQWGQTRPWISMEANWMSGWKILRDASQGHRIFRQSWERHRSPSRKCASMEGSCQTPWWPISGRWESSWAPESCSCRPQQVGPQPKEESLPQAEKPPPGTDALLLPALLKMAMRIYILSFLLEKRKSTHLANHTPLPGNRNESGCCLSWLGFIFFLPSFYARLFLLLYSCKILLRDIFFSPSLCTSWIVQSFDLQKEKQILMKPFSRRQVILHTPSQPFRMMSGGLL